MKNTTLIIACLSFGLGVSSAAEKAASGEVKSDLWKKFDTNGDGELDEKEREVIIKSIGGSKANAGAEEQKGDSFIERFDADGDGTISKEERAIGAKTLSDEKKMAGAQSGAKGAPGGKPSPERIAKMKKSRAEMLKRFDKDGDGELSKEERAEVRKAGTALINSAFNKSIQFLDENYLDFRPQNDLAASDYELTMIGESRSVSLPHPDWLPAEGSYVAIFRAPNTEFQSTAIFVEIPLQGGASLLGVSE